MQTSVWETTVNPTAIAMPGLPIPPRHQSKVPVEDLYKMACWKHAQAQNPWDAASVQYWQGAANALAWMLRSKSLNDRQLLEMEDDGIALGKQGRWDHTLDGLCEPDGTVERD